MSKMNSTSHKVYSAMYLLVTAVIGVYCALNATYNVLVGGSPFYFFAIMVLWVQSFFALYSSEKSRNLAGFGLVILVIGLVYTYGFTFLGHLKAIVLLPSICFTLFGLPSIAQNAVKINTLKTVLMFSLFALAAIQYYEITLLKNYYNTLPTVASWAR